MTQRRVASPTGSLAKAVPQVHKRQPISLGLLLFSALLIIGFADFSHDYAVFWGTGYWNAEILVPDLRRYVQLISSVLIGMLALMGIFNLLTRRSTYSASREVKLFLALFAMSTLLGVVVGLVKGVSLNYIVGDTRNAVTYLAIFAITGINTERGLKYLRNLFLFSCGMLVLKLFYAFASNLVAGEALRWRYLLKLSLFFSPMLFVALCLFMYSTRAAERRKYFWLTALAAGGIFAAQMRGIFLGTFTGLLFIFIMFVNKERLP